MRRPRPAVVVAALLLGACGVDSAEPAASLTVFAAASLTNAFTELGEAFEAGHPTADIAFNFGASSTLREQILGGAAADVFASASQSNIDQVIAGGEATTSSVFTTNVLQIAVPDGNPADITALADFANADRLIGLCAEEVPCGQFGRRALTKAGVSPSIDTNASDVRALLTQIESGDLDAALVYATDVLAADDRVDGVTIPTSQNVQAEYAITQLTDSAEPELAAAFVEFMRSDPGQAVLARFGFGGP